MVKSLFLAAVSAALLATAAAHPTCPHPTPIPAGAKINVVYFSDDKCTNTVPKTIYTREVLAGPCKVNPHQTYKSLIINSIDDQYIGTNSALQVGNTNSGNCDFTNSVKFSIATRDQVGKCQFIGIPQAGPGKPLLPGNEYQLAPLMG